MTAFLTHKEASGLGLVTNKPAKFRNQKVAVDGRTFHSIKEAERYRELCMERRSGLITHLTCQPYFELQPSFKVGKKTERAIGYIADFMYKRKADGAWVVEDVKSEITRKVPAYAMKRKLFLFKYQQKYTFVELVR